MARNEATNKPKKKKPENEKHKTVYFNTKKMNDATLYAYADKIENFSGWIKSLMYQEMIRRNGMPPNPYEYVSATVEPEMPQFQTIPVPVKPAKVEKVQKNSEEVKVYVGGEPVEVQEVKRSVEEPEEIEVEEIVEENEEVLDKTEEQEEEQETPQNSARSAAASAMLGMYKR
ncbi:TPA: hypothetical protein QCR36_004108 [Bacillus cereus]|nr:hypothetical protein [Bacillus cereus]HDR4742573.1 hypothetical protein [Bacillus cereus]HDR4748162.1 hypothetical protein [Bacillus cereus]HDR4753634.1 hypothetical protein [Bacillus cereus]HDR4770843.1 hypothetical protein [Bacillus cereus]